MQSYNHPGTTELAKCSWAGTQTISSLDLVRKIDLNVLNTWLAKQELPVRRSGPVRKIDTPVTSLVGRVARSLKLILCHSVRGESLAGSRATLLLSYTSSSSLYSDWYKAFPQYR